MSKQSMAALRAADKVRFRRAHLRRSIVAGTTPVFTAIGDPAC